MQCPIMFPSKLWKGEIAYCKLLQGKVLDHPHQNDDQFMPDDAVNEYLCKIYFDVCNNLHVLIGF